MKRGREKLGTSGIPWAVKEDSAGLRALPAEEASVGASWSAADGQEAPSQWSTQ